MDQDSQEADSIPEALERNDQAGENKVDSNRVPAIQVLIKNRFVRCRTGNKFWKK